MDKNLIRYMLGEINAVILNNVSISREKSKNGTECIYIKPEGYGNPMYTFWNNTRKKEKEPEEEKESKKRATGGGKKAYVMLMIEEISQITPGVNNGVDAEKALGAAVRLANNIEWSTGKIINKRNKKALTYTDLLKLYGCSNNRLNTLINDMTKLNIMYHTKEGYFVSPKYIKKGGAKK